MIDTAASRAERIRLAAVSLGVIAVGYIALSVFYFWEDFFKYVQIGGPVMTDRAGVAVPVDGSPYLWTILSPWRPALSALAVGLLGLSAVGLWRGRPRARVLALVTLWGVLLPQVLWYAEFVVDWHNGAGLTTVLVAAFAVVAVPTMLLFEGRETLSDWRPLGAGRARLLVAAIALGWLGHLATNFLDHSYRDQGWMAYGAAFLAVPLSALAIAGIINLRSWALWAGVGAALSLAMVPLSFEPSWAYGGAGYLDTMVSATTGSELRQLATAIVPIAAIWALTAPFLHAFVRKALAQNQEL
jgi:hypothetical protein